MHAHRSQLSKHSRTHACPTHTRLPSGLDAVLVVVRGQSRRSAWVPFPRMMKSNESDGVFTSERLVVIFIEDEHSHRAPGIILAEICMAL